MSVIQTLPHPPVLDADAAPVFDRVVLAIDFEPASLAAARWATTHVARGAHAILAHIAAVPELVEPDGAGDRPADAVRLATPLLEGGLAGLAGTLDVASHRVALRVGRASRWLGEIANGAEASLVVLGRRRDANRKRVGEPNVLERVARRTSASVLVVPEDAASPPSHVVAAVDESHYASAVVRTALRIARSLACPLTILHVQSPAAGVYDRILEGSRARRAPRSAPDLAASLRVPSRLSTRTARWLVSLLGVRRRDASARVEVGVGDPAREITARALTAGSAMVVVGQRGADEAPVGSLGSVARELLTRAQVPVFAVSAH